MHAPIINCIGYSGSGKTTLITNLLKLLKEMKNINAAVIKNIHEHQIDKKGKDTYLYADAGAKYSITKNIYGECTIFIKNPLEIEALVKWLQLGPFHIDMIFTEGFRYLKVPTILCIKDHSEINEQINDFVKMISLNLNAQKIEVKKEFKDYDIPIVEIPEEFEKFVHIFKLG
ncbi:MAG: Molybdopterin-guanine dinucleotide biosynthesis adapter protein [Promethearchaeota archaeon]|nr:MAG: Molybdopterin-guanine dinucleotide biosynthesis adapter protein [Candidatus Lokiarchaeota archaeon]